MPSGGVHHDVGSVVGGVGVPSVIVPVIAIFFRPFVLPQPAVTTLDDGAFSATVAGPANEADASLPRT